MKKLSLFMALTALLIGLHAQAQSQATAKCGETVELTATAKAGYKFVCWQDLNGNQVGTSATLEVTLDENTSIYDFKAVFEADSYTIVATANEATMGSVTGNGVSAAFGVSVELTAVAANKCYQFVRWSDGEVMNPRTVTVGSTIAANTYEAIFEEISFPVNVTSNNEEYGTVTISRK